MLEAVLEILHAPGRPGFEFVLEPLEIAPADHSRHRIVGEEEFMDGKAAILLLIEQQSLAENHSHRIGERKHRVLESLAGHELEEPLNGLGSR